MSTLIRTNMNILVLEIKHPKYIRIYRAYPSQQCAVSLVIAYVVQ